MASAGLDHLVIASEKPPWAKAGGSEPTTRQKVNEQ